MTNVTVYIIGAGPGDPELLTVKAQRILKSADVILYDYLAHPNIVMMGEVAEKVCVGKKKGAYSTQQDDIHKLLLEHSKKYNVIVRLKGGDPMIFGRCGEEMQFLKKHAIPYEIIPGITSAIAAPTYSGIPVTHRDYSQSVAFVTATRANDVENMNIPNADTLVIMMSLLRLDSLVKRLLESHPKETPIAIIQSGTLAAERTLVGTLETIVDLQHTHQLVPPALLVVGDVAALGCKFEWRNHLPLKNRRFVLFRSMHQQSTFRDMLYNAGAEVLTLPMNQIEPVHKNLDVINLESCTHIIFTSENGVNSFFNWLMKSSEDSRHLARKVIVAIGQHTQDSLTKYGIKADLVPDQMTSSGIVEMLKDQVNSQHRLLIPTSSEAGADIPEGLYHTGAIIDVVVAYKNEPTTIMDIAQNWLKPSDELVFMNAASVTRFNNAYPSLNKHVVYSIGPKTSTVLQQCHVQKIIEAKRPSLDDLFNEIIKENN